MKLFYYTTTQTMQYILKNGDIYATNMRYMNDSEEYRNGLEEIAKLMKNHELLCNWLENNNGGKAYFETEAEINKSIEKIFSEENLKNFQNECDMYSISFCEKRDLLSQWCNYAKESGVSLRLNFGSNGVRLKNHTGDKPENIFYKKKMKPEKVFYYTKDSMKEGEYNRYSRKILKKLFDEGENSRYNSNLEEELPYQWKKVSAYVKRYDFSQEAEYRLVFERKRLGKNPQIEYRMDKNVLKPYIDIECEGGWPIDEITVGPGFNQDAVFVSIKHFLNNVEVKNGIVNTADFLMRIQEYFKCAKEGADKKGVTLETLEKLRMKISSCENEKIEYMERNSWRVLVELVVKEIVEEKKLDEQIVKFYEENYFTNAGIILNKSAIPYIF